MAAGSFTTGSSSLFILSLTTTTLVLVLLFCPGLSDPDSLQDLCVADLSSKELVNGYPCKPTSTVTSGDFFFSGLTQPGNLSASPFGAAVAFGIVTTFPGLNTLGLSMNRVDYAPGGVVIPHTHPRATELVLVLEGSVLVGFLSTSNVLYSKVVKPGELFVIPMGLIHFQQNVGEGKAIAVATFNSQNGGAALISPALFGSKPPIPTDVLAKAFMVDGKLVDDIKSKFN